MCKNKLIYENLQYSRFEGVGKYNIPQIKGTNRIDIKELVSFNYAKSAKDTGVPKLAKKYPRAAAYIKAEGYAGASNYIKSSYGEEAMEAIRMGKSHTKAISEMERKWKKYTSSRRWD